METCVVITTYKRAWALPYSIASLKDQSIPPSKVVFVLKPSGDESEKVIEECAEGLNYEIVIQNEGNVAMAVELGIKACKEHDLILFLDDDALASKNWIEKYTEFFERNKSAGGASGIVYKAVLEDNKVSLIDEPFYGKENYTVRSGIHRRPLPEYKDYCEWLSTSGLIGTKQCNSSFIPSVILIGVNMAFKTNAVEKCPLSALYKNSRKCLHYEVMLSYCAKKKGFETYRIVEKGLSPKVYHIANVESLTRGKGLSHQFWIQYDFSKDYWRLRKLGARVNFLHYLIAMGIIARGNLFIKIPATLYAIVK
ncbi:glycosyltransferase family 2 protein [Fervidicoccus fontis]|uniref:Glycosyltransferase, family 2 n=2 Tax=Fervidicoccus fontis TaxID=683846 RepID=I0A114_FERFK|nr:glycosyltransferase family 2 protein [Fervidicoccus fontis]AFH42671.1 glycosyltransferase, family 2 [Fervidicoccus fontis Kam940]MBE9391250.1 glycosyltransferase family 2 protein [Fervidicoccus fontis]